MKFDRPLPRYKSHKVVQALKIKHEFASESAPDTALLEFEEPGYDSLLVDRDWYNKHKPEAGGYYVVYEDGYASYSPAKAFEEGYTRINEGEIPLWVHGNAGTTIRADKIVSVSVTNTSRVATLECGQQVDIPLDFMRPRLNSTQLCGGYLVFAPDMYVTNWFAGDDFEALANKVQE